jgi:hypothetical protein
MHCLAASVRDVIVITCCIETGTAACPDPPQDIHTRGLRLSEETILMLGKKSEAGN